MRADTLEDAGGPPSTVGYVSSLWQLYYSAKCPGLISCCDSSFVPRVFLEHATGVTS